MTTEANSIRSMFLQFLTVSLHDFSFLFRICSAVSSCLIEHKDQIRSIERTQAMPLSAVVSGLSFGSSLK